MNRLASPAQLRASFLRWALFAVPLVVLLGWLSGVAGGSSADSPWFQGLSKPSTFPPLSAARSTTTEPGFIALTMSRVTSSGAGRPGTAAVVMRTSDFAT